MDALKNLHDNQDEFIRKTLQEDKIVSQPIFNNFSVYMNKTKVKVKRYSYKQQKIIILLLLLLTISIGFNIYLTVVKETPIIITNIFQPAQEKTSNPDKKDSETDKQLVTEKENESTNIVENKLETEIVLPENTTNNTKTNTVIKEEKPVEEPINTTITPDLFTEVNTSEIKDFVNQFAIGINKLDLSNTSDLESNTILLYITQQYFSKKSSSATSLTVDADYASSSTNFHKFLSELTINNYSGIDHLESYNNYIGFVARSKSYSYGEDYSSLSKEKYNCEDVTIISKKDNIYTAKAKVTRTYEGKNSTYEVTFTFKENNNYKYQKYKLLSLKSQITSSTVDNVIHLVGK